MDVIINESLLSFETDFRELVQAFYPYTQVSVTVGEASNTVGEASCFPEANVGEASCFPRRQNAAPTNVRANCASPTSQIDLRELFSDYTIDPAKPRKQIKNEIKRKLYKYLSEKLNKTLPWGALTGIRPVNIITSIVENKKYEMWLPEDENITYEKIKDHLLNEYLVSDEKADELIEIAKKEIEILNRPEVKNYKNEFSLYVGVPFCKSTCLYCSFTSYDINKNKKNVKLYLDALKKEFNDKKLDKSPMTIYVGGGTPTSLEEEDFEIFLNILDENIDKKNTIEYTIEAGRPDTITEKKLMLMKEHGVTRISINPQTFNQKTLDLIGRKHTVKDIYDKYNLSINNYIDNINMDLIIGLPEEGIEDVEHTINETLNLSPTSITIHSLALKRAARLNLEKDKWLNLDNEENYKKSDLVYEMFNLVQNKINETKLYSPYYLYRQKNIAANLENIGYSKPNKECIYNIMMMSERHTVLAYGCGGVSKIVKRFDDGTYVVERKEGYKGLAEYLGVI